MLLPILYTNGQLSYDTARYQNIGAVGMQINDHCVGTAQVGEQGRGTGGYERVGTIPP